MGSWTAKTTMPTARGSLSVGVMNGILYAVGGYDNSYNCLSTSEAYDPSADAWATKTSMPVTRADLSTAVVNGILYAVGGYKYDGQPLYTISGANSVCVAYTATVTPTITPTASFTDTPSPTPTSTSTDTPTATATSTETPTDTPTSTATPTPTSSNRQHTTPSSTLTPIPSSAWILQATITPVPSSGAGCPFGVAVGAGYIAVSDGNNPGIVSVFDKNGNYLYGISPSTGYLGGMAIDYDGELYLTEFGTGVAGYFLGPGEVLLTTPGPVGAVLVGPIQSRSTRPETWWSPIDNGTVWNVSWDDDSAPEPNHRRERN